MTGAKPHDRILYSFYMNRAVVFIIAGLIYLVWPFDIAPDYLAVVGWLDDVLVLAVSIYMAVQSFRRRVRSGLGKKEPPAPPNRLSL